jgi:hypothetical protein
MSVWPAPSPRGHTHAVIGNRFFYALRIRMYALRNLLRAFTVFYGGVNDLGILILYAAKFDGWVVGPLLYCG